MATKPLVIVGASGFGREVVCVVKDINADKPKWDLLGLVDDNLLDKTIEGYPILGNIDSLSDMKIKPYVSVAIADPKARKEIVKRLEELGFVFATLIHPTTSMSEFVNIGEGTIICRNNYFTTNVEIGPHCIINVNITIGHDTRIGAFSSIMSHTAIGGDVIMGCGCYFGLNCTVINRVKLGRWSKYGAGTVVVKDMPENIKAVGVPAKIIGNND